MKKSELEQIKVRVGRVGLLDYYPEVEASIDLAKQLGIDPERIFFAVESHPLRIDNDGHLRPWKTAFQAVVRQIEMTAGPEPTVEPTCANCQGTKDEPLHGCRVRWHGGDVFGWGVVVEHGARIYGEWEGRNCARCSAVVPNKDRSEHVCGDLKAKPETALLPSLDAASGADLDAIGKKIGAGPRRSKGEGDASYRHRLKGWERGNLVTFSSKPRHLSCFCVRIVESCRSREPLKVEDGLFTAKVEGTRTRPQS